MIKFTRLASVVGASAALVVTAAAQYSVSLFQGQRIIGLDATRMVTSTSVVNRDGSGTTVLPSGFSPTSARNGMISGSRNNLASAYNMSTGQVTTLLGGAQRNAATDGVQFSGQRISSVTDPFTAETTTTYEALLWRDITSAPIVLTSLVGSGIADVRAMGGNSIVGSIDSHVTLWDATTLTSSTLTPSWATRSQATSAAGEYQGGGAGTGADGYKPTFWKGTAASAVDLTPAGYSYGLVNGIRGNQQVGYVQTTASNKGPNKAMLWNSSSTDFVDIHAYLNLNAGGLTFTTSSLTGFGEDGSIFGAGVAGGQSYGFVLSNAAPVPEPASMAALGLGLLGLVRKRRAAKN